MVSVPPPATCTIWGLYTLLSHLWCAVRNVRLAVGSPPRTTGTALASHHKLSPKHLDRYVRGLDTADQMAAVATGLVGKRLLYRQLIADNGLDSGARS